MPTHMSASQLILFDQDWVPAPCSFQILWGRILSPLLLQWACTKNAIYYHQLSHSLVVYLYLQGRSLGAGGGYVYLGFM